MSGWIRVHRGWRECDVFTGEPASEREAWLHLIEIAAWKPMLRRAGKGDVIQVNRGQLHTAERTLADMWLWDRKKVKRFLNRLEKYGMISQEAGPSGNLVTICNYEAYQTHGTDSGTNNGSNQGPSEDHPRTTQEEGIRKEKKGEEEKNLTERPSSSSTSYAFEGETIRLNASDFEKWATTYRSIVDLRAELTALDAWWSNQPVEKRKKWFHSTSAMLNKKHQELTVKQKAGGTPDFLRDVMISEAAAERRRREREARV